MKVEKYFNYAGIILFLLMGLSSISRVIIGAMDIPLMIEVLDSSSIFGGGMEGYFIYYYGSLLFAAFSFCIVLSLYENILKM